jgi:hypothetical protein
MISGTLFGAGLVLYGFPYLSEIFDNKIAIIKHDQTRMNQLRAEALEKISESMRIEK